ncbi:1-aminocyclopropane-1-carboxylate deaminase/D-cysteine desulfhydrase [Actinophytocola sp.]|uniref:1-aminocyclopropane-1-carboxylate deaminase/D-cysteine desulfhydrase n=1 Tax=Actinophytocola sp. TaxID=1872138 RepID=UPI002ED02E9B
MTPLVEVCDRRLNGVRLFLKRDDLLEEDLPGNKWRKLKYNLVAAREQGYDRLLTFGGAYSNHIRAVAAAGQRFGFATVGVIRGEECLPLNESLAYAVQRGMRLVYLDRGTYRRKAEPGVVDELLGEFGPAYVLPEGGSNALAVRGCAELPGEIDIPFDVICCACGTGGTLAGIAAGLRGQRALGFSVLKGGRFLDDDVRRLQGEHPTANWSIDYDFHFGGYAKRTPALDAFVADFQDRHGVRLDRVYEAKMMYGLFARIADGVFPEGTVMVAVVA